ncbi:CDP-diacylglycerol--inositol 3-phosphatidyltransferase 1 [Acorus calamus]|uniref:CDP-diacylglycerol--inositol 3-phosphatidyltransferase 1 n=1 Tax=Acorus calamus TaxID=4465 RepID=A0AAV9EKD6_ACOCL|nr:CDP-diacylglycerol--inositol 3-phosphatidyltransferase 1 [Acorus calamus]
MGEFNPGYIRILMNCVAFALCFSNKKLFSILYFIRVSTACLLVVLDAVKEDTLLSFVVALSLFGWAIKQVVNVIQMKTAADACVLHDMKRR